MLTMAYAIGFVGNFHIPIGGWVFVPKGLGTGGADGPLWQVLLVDAVLLGIFAVQHSVMARQRFKYAWTRIIPPAIERSTYVVASSLALILLFWLWRPIGGMIWSLESSAAQIMLVGLSLLGWALVLVTTNLIDAFEMLGLRQVFYHLKGRDMPVPEFVTPGFYKLVRHPMMVGFLIAFWATPVMTGGHLVFAMVTTAYIFVALQFEERDLVRLFGDRYRAYRQRVRMLIPVPRRTAMGGKPPANVKRG